MVRFFQINGNNEAYATLVDSEVVVETIEDSPPSKDDTTASQNDSGLVTFLKVAGLILILALVTIVASLSTKLYYAKKSTKLVGKGEENTICHFETSRGPPGKDDESYYLHHVAQGKCLDACISLRHYDPTVTGITTSKVRIILWDHNPRNHKNKNRRKQSEIFFTFFLSPKKLE